MLGAKAKWDEKSPEYLGTKAVLAQVPAELEARLQETALAAYRALRVRGLVARELATALLRFGTAGTGCAPAGALAVGEGELTARVNRLLTPQPPLSRAVQAGIVLASAILATTPVLLLIAP